MGRHMKRRRIGIMFAAAVCICLLAALGLGPVYRRWRWLGYPAFRDVLVNLSDSYPGHGLSCIRGGQVTYHSFLGDARNYGDFVERYGEPGEERLEEEDSFCRLTAVYDEYILVYQGHGDMDKGEYTLREMTVLSNEVEMPVSRVRLGSRKWEAERGYCFNETEVIDGEMYYCEDLCMMCGTDRFYISLQYEDDRVSGVRVWMGTSG